MHNFTMFYILIIIILVIASITVILLQSAAKTNCSQTRRRWKRIKIPAEKHMSCRVVEPASIASDLEYVVVDINIGGISFISAKPFAKKVIRLLIRFPFSDYSNASSVRAKVAYSKEITKDKYRIGVEYQKER